MFIEPPYGLQRESAAPPVSELGIQAMRHELRMVDDSQSQCQAKKLIIMLMLWRLLVLCATARRAALSKR